MQLYRDLLPFPGSDVPAQARVEVEIDWEGRSWIYTSFRFTGFGSEIVLPSLGVGRQDALWRHTCCEVFGLRSGGGYAEFNLSPGGGWAAYGFDGYRSGMANLDVGAPRIDCQALPGGFQLTAIPYWSGWPSARALALSAVVEMRDGSKTYWALAHPSDKPDFHHPDSFTLVSPMLDQR